MPPSRPSEVVHIQLVKQADNALVEAFTRLLPQLSRSAATLTLVHFRIPTGVRAWIEDVVVDDEARGLGAGAALTRAAIARSRELGAKTLDLTSNPGRQAAHRLYESCGFAPRDTRVYRHQGPETATPS
ncbi:GNAT family N-acetyltransferase [Bordetella petrii]|uniref:GNAT family N-acetyltransferase n=1 Tax=Bordetella petrii TaxID=94624 RepID=UPI001E4FE2DD|nr:GNAT family N-acetyltransferase [Bordetella petrii]MCD0503598.1 GNAT family N-acetyltransferase [Bordetella petrii]